MSQYMGRDATGDRWFVDIELEEVNKPVRFTDHTNGNLRYVFTASFELIEKGHNNVSAAGQMGNQLDLYGFRPAKGWKVADVQSLLAIWQEWHLNTMNAGSDEHRANGVSIAAMGDEALKVVDSHGYKFGHSWLARQLPDEVVTEIRRLQSLGQTVSA